MTIVDTNVVSEALKPLPSPFVMGWMDEQPEGELFTTSVTQAEILYGIELMPHGKRRNAFREETHSVFNEDFAGRILPFDSAAAGFYAEIVASRRRSGRPISPPDAQIAAIARVYGCRLATRNVNDSRDCGVAVINPWAA